MKIFFDEKWNNPDNNSFYFLSYSAQLHCMGAFDDLDTNSETCDIVEAFANTYFRGMFGLSNVARDGMHVGAHIFLLMQVGKFSITNTFSGKTERINELCKNIFKREFPTNNFETVLKDALNAYTSFISYFPTNMNGKMLERIFESFIMGFVYTSISKNP